ncbi:MAG TPA: hypothetical protein DDY49_08915 [Paenibacillaceae bacterium]|nr:hypothetical protein [Paenibacillaceae bacterium]
MEHVSIRNGAKKAFNTKEEARRAAQRVTDQSGNKMNYYQCSVCGLWHIGWSGEVTDEYKGKGVI